MFKITQNNQKDKVYDLKMLLNPDYILNLDLYVITIYFII